jgi:exosortase family protein XrtF
MNVSEKWKQIPGPVKTFLWKAMAIFIVWKVMYLSILIPNRVLDRPITDAVSAGTTRTLNFFSKPSDYTLKPGVNVKSDGEREDVMVISRGQERVLSIADACNGLEVIVLYAGLIVCLPSRLRRKTLFIVSGIFFIEALNVLRCAGLALVYQRYPQYLDFSHHYLFTFIVYAAIFWLWYLFSKGPGFAQKLQLNGSNSEQTVAMDHRAGSDHDPVFRL